MAASEKFWQDMLPYCDYVVPTQHSMRVIHARASPEEIVGMLLRNGAENRVLKMGRDGSLLARHEGCQRVPAVPVNVVNITGAADSLVGQFIHSRAEETVVRLESLPEDDPNYDWREWMSIWKITLVLASRPDPIQPSKYGETNARRMPGAGFKEITPELIRRERHFMDVQESIEEFFARHFGHWGVSTC